MDHSLPGSSVHGILQARTLEWVAIPFSRGSSLPRDGTRVSCTAGGFLPCEPSEKPQALYRAGSKGPQQSIHRWKDLHLQVERATGSANAWGKQQVVHCHCGWPTLSISITAWKKVMLTTFISSEPAEHKTKQLYPNRFLPSGQQKKPVKTERKSFLQNHCN